MKNLIETSTLLMSRRIGLYQQIKKNLQEKNIGFDDEKLVKTLGNIEHNLLMSSKEQTRKKLSPKTTIGEIMKDNPYLGWKIYCYLKPSS